MGKGWLWWPLAAAVPLIGMYLAAFDIFKSLESINVWYPQNASGVRVPTCARLDAAQLGGTEDLHLAGDLLFASSSPYRRETGHSGAAAAFATARNISLAGRNLSKLGDRVSLLGRAEQGSLSVASAASLRASAAGVPALATPAAREAFARTAGAAWQALPLLGWDWAAEPDFHPLGISVHAPQHQPDAPVRLAAVVLTRARSLAAVFDLVQRGPEPAAERPVFSRDLHAGGVELLPRLALRTAAVLMSDTHIRNLNDIDFLDANTVISTNFLDTPGRDDAGAAFELLSLRRWGSIVACRIPEAPTGSTPAQCRTLASGLAQPNGIAFEHSQRRLWVSSILDRSVSWYSLRGPISADDGAALESLELELKGTVDIGAGADNLSLASAVPASSAAAGGSGAVSVWVASHPLLYRFGMAAGDPTSIAPNHVAYLSVSGGASPTVSVHAVLVDPTPAETGLGSGGSSVAVPLAVTSTHLDFVVGTVFDRGVTICRVPRTV